MLRVCVVHLARAQNGVTPFAGFLESYANTKTVPGQELAILFKGFDGQPDLLRAHKDLLAKQAYHALPVPDEGFDIVPYFHAVQKLDADVLCFLNSFSRPLDADWLTKLYGHLERDGVGIVGATSSCLSYRDYYREHRAELDNDPFYASRVGCVRLALLLRAYHHWYAPFPNPFMRSNAFMARRDVLNRVRVPAIRKKTHAYRFESGLHGLTRQIQAQGLRPLVVGKDGQGYEIADWHKSDTFMQGNQDNLLVEDNQTRRYQEADDATRLQFARNSWGPNAAPALGDKARRT